MNPLDIGLELRGVDTSFPSPAVGRHKVACRGIEPKESTNTPGLWMLKVTLELQEPADDAHGKPLQPGFKFTTNITLPGAPGADADTEAIRLKSTAAFVDAALGTTMDDRPNLKEAIAMVPDKVFFVNMKKSKDEGFAPTQVGSFSPLPKAE